MSTITLSRKQCGGITPLVRVDNDHIFTRESLIDKLFKPVVRNSKQAVNPSAGIHGHAINNKRFLILLSETHARQLFLLEPSKLDRTVRGVTSKTLIGWQYVVVDAPYTEVIQLDMPTKQEYDEAEAEQHWLHERDKLNKYMNNTKALDKAKKAGLTKTDIDPTKDAKLSDFIKKTEGAKTTIGQAYNEVEVGRRPANKKLAKRYDLARRRLKAKGLL